MWTRIVLNLLLVSVALGMSACAADLRSDSLEKLGAHPAEANTSKARAVLQTMAKAHGMETWKGFESAEVVFRDDWDSVMASMMGLQPWDEEDLIRMRYQPGTFNIRVDIMEGSRKGEVIGLQSWNSYGRKSDKEEIQFNDDMEVAGFILPAIAYIIEMPFRMQNASTVAYDGEKTVNGKRYDVVLATWGSLEPQDKVDQYLLWIEKDTGLLGMVDFTVRDQFSFISSRTIYSDYKEIQGVMVATQATIVDTGGLSKEGYLHQISLSSVAFDKFPVSFLHPNSKLKFMGDAKASR